MLLLGKGKTSKKVKPEPTGEEMHAVVVDILKQVDFNTVSNAFKLDFTVYSNGWVYSNNHSEIHLLYPDAGNFIRYYQATW